MREFTAYGEWKSRNEMPDNDFDLSVYIKFDDGYEALSDGGTVHDDKSIEFWKHVK